MNDMTVVTENAAAYVPSGRLFADEVGLPNKPSDAELMAALYVVNGLQMLDVTVVTVERGEVAEEGCLKDSRWEFTDGGIWQIYRGESTFYKKLDHSHFYNGESRYTAGVVIRLLED